MDSSKALIRCEQEENVDCRLPTGSSYLERPPDVRVLLQVLLACWYSIAQERDQRIRMLH